MVASVNKEVAAGLAGGLLISVCVPGGLLGNQGLFIISECWVDGEGGVGEMVGRRGMGGWGRVGQTRMEMVEVSDMF